MDAPGPTIGDRVSARTDGLTAERTRLVGGAAALSLIPPVLYATFFEPALPSAGVAIGAVVFAAGAYFGFDRRWIPERRGTLVLSLVHFTVVTAIAAFYASYGSPGYLDLGALAMLAYAAVQLDARHFVVVFALDVLLLLAASAALGQLSGVVAMTMVGAVGLGSLMHVANRRFTEGSERLRAQAEASAQALEAALVDARHQIRERERAEAERATVETARAQLEERLVEAHRLEAIGTLAGGFAHDMNNLLAGINGLASIIREQGPSDVKADADEIVAATRRGAELTQSLLTLGRRRPARRDPMSLEPSIARVASLLARTLPKRLKVAVVLDGELTLLGDHAQLEQALLNLCLNAVDAMEGEGALSITARSETLAAERAASLGLPPDAYVVLSVTDDGHGMAPETVRRMFEPFFTTKEPGRGTGLGLTMVYGTVQAHGGALDVDSEPGRGTTIRVYLPAARIAVASTSHPTPLDLRRSRHAVLVVDDDPLLRTTTRRLLERTGHEVLLAEGGARALELFTDRRDVVVLLDLAMPGMDGPETFRRLRAIDPDARVVLTSGYAFQKDVQACLESGARAFLEKPYDAKVLVATLAEAAR